MAKPKPPKSHCPKNHPLSGPNLYTNPKSGSRHCRTCLNAATKAWIAKKRLQNPSHFANYKRTYRQEAQDLLNARKLAAQIH